MYKRQYDDKRYVLDDGQRTLAKGLYRIREMEEGRATVQRASVIRTTNRESVIRYACRALEAEEEEEEDDI